jgi:hypothetical protein
VHGKPAKKSSAKRVAARVAIATANLLVGANRPAGIGRICVQRDDLELRRPNNMNPIPPTAISASVEGSGTMAT